MQHAVLAHAHTASMWHHVVRTVRKMPGIPGPLLSAWATGGARSSPTPAQTRLSACLPLFLPFKQRFSVEGEENFLSREGTSLIWACSPSTFLTRDPFKAGRSPGRWHPSLLPFPLCFRLPGLPDSFSLSSHLTHNALLLMVTHCLPFSTDHTHSATLTVVLRGPWRCCVYLLPPALDFQLVLTCHTLSYSEVVIASWDLTCGFFLF